MSQGKKAVVLLLSLVTGLLLACGLGEVTGFPTAPTANDAEMTAVAQAKAEARAIAFARSKVRPLDPPLKLPAGRNNVSALAFSPDGKTLAAISRNTVLFWNVATHTLLNPPLVGDKLLNSLAYSPDGKLIVTGACGKREPNRCIQGEISVWDVSTRQLFSPPLVGHTTSVSDLVFSPDGQRLASASYDGTIIVWDIANRTPHTSPFELSTTSNGFSNLALNPNGKLLARGYNEPTTDGSNAIGLWDMDTGELVGTFVLEAEGVSSVAFSPDGEMLVSSSTRSIIFWDVVTRQPIGQPVATGAIAIAFSPRDMLLAGGSSQDAVVLVDVRTRAVVLAPLEPTTLDAYANMLAFSPDGRLLAAATSQSSAITLLDLESAGTREIFRDPPPLAVTPTASGPRYSP